MPTTDTIPPTGAIIYQETQLAAEVGGAEVPADLTIEPVEFWFIWTKKGQVPRRAHNSQALADDEAARLARLRPGKKFIVLRAERKFSVAAPGEAA